MTEFHQPDNAGQNPGQVPGPNPGFPAGPPLAAAEKARGLTRTGIVVGAGGLGLMLLTCVGMVLVVGHDFPGVQLVGLLILFLSVIGLVAMVRGIIWIFQGLRGAAKARQSP